VFAEMTAGAIQLAQPGWLWLLPVLGAAAVWTQRIARRRPAHDGADVRFVHPLIGLLQPAMEGKRGRHAGWLYWVVLACLVLALARPQRLGEWLPPQPPPSRDITLIVDTSVSMALRDYELDGRRIDRMTLLKGILARFVAGLPGDRIAVVVYGDHPYTLVPLTSDHALVRTMLMRIGIGLAGRTDGMGAAVALAVKQDAGRAPRRRVLILFSDGARPTGDITPRAAAALAAQDHMRLYTVAIGARTAGAAEHSAATLVYDPADRRRLAAMAKRTGGRLYWAGDSRALSRAIHDIARLETPPVKRKPRQLHQPLYQWPLLAGLLLLALLRLGDILRGREP
jgi:Ca-activated chloride channel family protein